MKTYRKMLAAMAAFVAVTVGAAATPVYYTIFHALEEDSREVFRYRGEGSLMLSTDGGSSYETIASFRFDKRGRGVAKVYELNKAPGDAQVKLVASFNESSSGQPADTVIEASVDEFIDSLTRYKRRPWLTYSPVYVSYETLPDIVNRAIEAGSFSVLVKAVQAAGLEETLRGEGPFTVFAPTDEAFGKLLGELGVSAEELLANPELGNILLYHVVGAALDGDAVSAETHLETVLGIDVEVEIVGDDLFINDSKVIVGNIEASNGIIHVLDTVLLPPALPTIPEVAADAGIFNTLVAALQKTGLDAALTNEGPFTVFAPTDEAFGKLLGELGVTPEQLLESPDLQDILLYHVVEGRLKADAVVAEKRLQTLLGDAVDVTVTEEGVFIDDSKIVLTNIKAGNGIIHVIDMVLIPQPDIVDVAIGNGSFTTLVGALEATGLDDVLRGDGPYTVFAPTDEAFEALPDWLLNFLVNNPKWLKYVLFYHVVPGDFEAADVVEQRRLRTANNKRVAVSVKDGEVFINRSKVIATDIKADNGTIHVIDRVLTPWRSY